MKQTKKMSVKRILIVIAILAPFLIEAQSNGGGIKWTEGLSWQQIVKKAKIENKFIFVDCYASWCKPCKLMDRTVYLNDTIGHLMNDKFISVKVQLDTSSGDNDNVKLHYTTARNFENNYRITGLPTFLFFSPDGIIRHKSAGAIGTNEFVQLVADAGNPAKQIYSRIDSWRKGRLNYKMMPQLAKDLTESSEAELANKVAKDYLHRLEKEREDAFLTKEGIEFIGQYFHLIKSSDRIFCYYQQHPGKIDEIMGIKGYCNEMVYSVIKREEIAPTIKQAKYEGDSVINWGKIEAAITKKYSQEITHEVLSDVKLSWYFEKEQWKDLISEATERIERKGHKNESGIFLNNVAWIIFERSNDKNEMEKALLWLNNLMTDDARGGQNSRVWDTKANLLYKLGRVNEAIALEEQVVKKNPPLKETLDKMKQGVPTWPIQ